MERLTRKSWRNLDPWETCGQDNYCKRRCHEQGGCTKGCIVPRIYARLAAYEDAGLQPEEIKKHEAAYNECLTRTYGPFKEKISQWLQAERDGRLVVLPCKVGAPVYTTHWRKDVKEKCTDSHGKPFYRMVPKNIIKKERFNPFGPDYEWLGKTVFLTREEAEAALAQKGGEG